MGKESEKLSNSKLDKLREKEKKIRSQLLEQSFGTSFSIAGLKKRNASSFGIFNFKKQTTSTSAIEKLEKKLTNVQNEISKIQKEVKEIKNTTSEINVFEKIEPENKKSNDDEKSDKKIDIASSKDILIKEVKEKTEIEKEIEKLERQAHQLKTLQFIGFSKDEGFEKIRVQSELKFIQSKM